MEDRQELRGEKEEHAERRDLRGKRPGSGERMEGRERTRAQMGKRKRGEHSRGVGATLRHIVMGFRSQGSRGKNESFVAG